MAIKLYHGSNVTVSEPKILESSRALDFGNAFYMISRLEQAKKWARLTAERRKSGTPVVAEFDFDDKRLGELNVIRYMSPDREWLKFVSGCRTRKLTGGEYDVIIGPVANDRTFSVISLYLIGAYDEDEAIRRLLPFKLADQYAFKSERSLELLTFKRGLYV